MTSDRSTKDSRMMRRALDLALRGRFGASPNPLVGAVVVDRAGTVVGEGFHASYGGPHAEIVALREAGQRAAGGSLFVTLEPCNHHGKTPPCVDAILEAGIIRVVAAMRDPNAVASGGMERLRTEGVDATISGESERARHINRRWLTWARFRRPWVTLKAATSLDGRIATRTGQSKWITGSEARHRSLELREEHDAILVGVRTIVEDDPRLTRRLGLNPTEGWRRVILDSRLRTPTEAAVVRMEPDHTLIAHTTEAPREHRSRLADTGVQLVEFAPDTSGRVPLQALLEHLARLEIAALLVEGGAEVHGSFVDAGLVDETVFFVAPMLIGGPSLSAVAGRGIADLELAPRLVFDSISRRGNDLELCAVRREDDDVHGSD